MTAADVSNRCQAEVMRDETYVPNDVEFGVTNHKVMVITGPNMAVRSRNQKCHMTVQS
jgi:DNA mismatch repair ATPase MutS